MILKEIQTHLSAFEIHLALENGPGSVFLDSGKDPERLGRYSIIVANPYSVIKSKDQDVWVDGIHEKGNPLDRLQQLMATQTPNATYAFDIPFIGGAVGFFAYDLGHHMEVLPRTAVDDVGVPDLFVGLYDGAVVVDHLENKTYITDAGVRSGERDRVEEKLQQIRAFEKSPSQAPVVLHKNRPDFQSNFTKPAYIDALTQMKEYIRQGDIYIANMTQRFQTPLRDKPLGLYKKLRDVNPAPFAGYLDFGQGQILSSSPERFIQLRGGQIETRPIKGTVPRGKTPEEDLINQGILRNSEKDKAELLMIVDLERNDLSRIAKVGTVKVPELFTIEEYATVYHLVSTVTADLRDDLDAFDVIKATFPGGSITGAPKIRAMEVIDELEPTQRNIYTGSIGYIDFNGNADLNIVIRTMVLKNDQVYFQVGGGIVWDSDVEAEYQETLDKAKALMEALSL